MNALHMVVGMTHRRRPHDGLRGVPHGGVPHRRGGLVALEVEVAAERRGPRDGLEGVAQGGSVDGNVGVTHGGRDRHGRVAQGRSPNDGLVMARLDGGVDGGGEACGKMSATTIGLEERGRAYRG